MRVSNDRHIRQVNHIAGIATTEARQQLEHGATDDALTTLREGWSAVVDYTKAHLVDPADDDDPYPDEVEEVLDWLAEAAEDVKQATLPQDSEAIQHEYGMGYGDSAWRVR